MQKLLRKRRIRFNQTVKRSNMAIRAAVHYRLMGVAGSGRGGIVTEIIEIVRQAVHDQPDQPDPFDDDAPGG